MSSQHVMVVDLEMCEEKVGPFLGPSGKNIRFILGKTKREINPDRDESVDLSNLHCKVEVTDENKVIVRLSANDESHLEVLKKNILAQQDYVMGRVEKKSKSTNPKKPRVVKKNSNPKQKRFTTKYVFKTSMEHHMISKFIGSGGSNINDLKESVVLSDENLQGNKMSVSIHEDRKIRMKNLHFEHLQTDFDSESKVLVTVELNTTNRNATLETVRKYVKQFVEKANLSNFSNDQSVSFTPQNDSGELENPF